MKETNRASLIKIVCAILAVMIGVGILLWRQHQPRKSASDAASNADYEITVTEPTCTEKGFSTYRDKATGRTEIRDEVPPLGHDWSEWQTIAAPDGVEPGQQSRVCSRCQSEETQPKLPDDPLSKIVIFGGLDGIGKKEEVPVTVSFFSPDNSFTDFATLKYQGHSSLAYEKKNFTMKLYLDEDHSEKDKRVFYTWQKENKYILKANAIDPSQARNLVCAHIWGQMVAARDVVPERLQGLSNYGAVDGFPVALYWDDAFYGLYTMNLHKDGDLFGMEDGQKDALVIINQNESEAVRFRAPASFADENSDWELEYCGTEDGAWAEEQLNALIAFVRESDDETFRAKLSDYMDVDAAVDYLLAIYALGLQDSGVKDLLMASFDGGVWIPSLYDMENAFGLNADGLGYDTSDRFIPRQENGVWTSATGSLLWDRIVQNFRPELQARYRALRGTILQNAAVEKQIDEWIGAIPAAYYAADAQKHPTTPRPEGDWAQQMKQDFERRTALLDQIFEL